MDIERWRDPINWGLGSVLVLLCILILDEAEESKTSSEHTKDYIMKTIERKIALQSIKDEETGIETIRYEGTDITTWLREHKQAIAEKKRRDQEETR